MLPLVRDNYNLFNIPNPVRHTTTINYSLAGKSKFKIILYNETGEEIKLLETGTKENGAYTLEVDCSNLSSGIYYYKMIKEKINITKK